LVALLGNRDGYISHGATFVFLTAHSKTLPTPT
jgi:hypothetical protein